MISIGQTAAAAAAYIHTVEVQKWHTHMKYIERIEKKIKTDKQNETRVCLASFLVTDSQ